MNIEQEMGALRRLATALTRDSAQAEDLVQDTWVAALRRPPEERDGAGPWLRTVMRNRHGSLLRARRVRERHDATIATEPPTTAEQLALTRQLLDEVAALSADDRELILLRFWEGLDATECGARLGCPASTVRTRLSRALQRLRKRMDRKHGGREAWMAALVPLTRIDPPASVGAPAALNAKTLTAGGVLAATLLWLGVAIPNGCEVDGETAQPDAARAQPTATETETTPTATPTRSSPAVGVKTPAPGGGGEDNESEERDLQAYGAPTGSNGGVHPQLAVAMSLRGVWDEVGRCRVGKGEGKARMTNTFRFESDGTTTFVSTEFTEVEGLSPGELDCVRNTFEARELDVRKVDITQSDFPAGTTVRYVIGGMLFLDEDGQAVLESINQHPPTNLETIHLKDVPLREAVARCGEGPVTLDLTFASDTGALARVEPDGEATKTTRCIAQALQSHVLPSGMFEPKHRGQDMLSCTFGLEGETPPKYECKLRVLPDLLTAID